MEFLRKNKIKTKHAKVSTQNDGVENNMYTGPERKPRA